MSLRTRVILGVVGTVLLAATGGCLSCSIGAGSAWKEFVPAQEARVERAIARQGERAPLIGPSRSGNAFDGYDRVASDLKGRPGVLKDGAQEQWLTAMMQAADASARLRDAARCDRAEYDFDWSRGMTANTPGLLGTQYAANALVLAARFRRQAGNVDGAIDDLGACLQMGTDVSRVPTLICGMIGVAICRVAQDELRQVVRDRRATSAQLTRVRKLLEDFETRFPSASEMLDSEAAVSMQSFRDAAEGRSSAVVPPLALRVMAWKHGFSSKGLVAESSREFERVVESVGRMEALDRVAAKSLADQSQAEAKQGNYLSRLALPGLVAVERTVREVRARNALLRAAIVVREGRTSRDWPLDPFTLKPIGYRDEGEWSVIWSAGRDGPDTGTGLWRVQNGSDIVLRVRK
jgi:hypothetical protein